MDELGSLAGPRKEAINNHCRDFMQMIKDIQFTLRDEIKSACDYRPFEKYVLSQLDGMAQTISQYQVEEDND